MYEGIYAPRASRSSSARARAPTRSCKREREWGERARGNEREPTSDELVLQRATQTWSSTSSILLDDRDNFVDKA